MSTKSGGLIFGAAAAIAALMARTRHASRTKASRPPGSHSGMDHTALYAFMSRHLLTGFYKGVAASIHIEATAGRILEVGCGPGHLAIALADRHDRDVTAIDLDPAMIEQAKAQMTRRPIQEGGTLSLQIADVASLPYPNSSFDLVVSTLAMHHWEDLPAALNEISRVLKPGRSVLIWDFAPGSIFPRHVSNSQVTLSSSPLVLVSVTRWRWPWKLTPIQLIALALPQQ